MKTQYCQKTPIWELLHVEVCWKKKTGNQWILMQNHISNRMFWKYRNMGHPTMYMDEAYSQQSIKSTWLELWHCSWLFSSCFKHMQTTEAQYVNTEGIFWWSTRNCNTLSDNFDTSNDYNSIKTLVVKQKMLVKNPSLPSVSHTASDNSRNVTDISRLT
jgi:hypothetical protein